MIQDPAQTVIIGAGVAGMAAGIRSACAGQKTTVIESASGPGGKLAEFHSGPYRFDRGPSLFTWPDLVLELDQLVRDHLEATGASPAQIPPAFRYERLDRSTHYFWEDGKKLTAWADEDRFVKEATEVFDIPARRLIKHLARSRDIFDVTRSIFLEQSLHDWSPSGKRGVIRALGSLHRLPWMGSLHGFNARKLREPHLVQLFDRYATYNGSDPHRAPAMLHVIPHLEHGMGTYFPEGGMYSITRHLHTLGKAVGVEFIFNASAKRILHSQGRVTGVEYLIHNKDVAPSQTPAAHRTADLVISNADVHPTYRNLLQDIVQPEDILSQERSTSGLIFYWGIKGVHPELHLHNILFSRDYEREFNSILKAGHPGDDPTVYINITSKLNPTDAPAGGENWFVMVNTSANPEQIESQIPEIRQRILHKIQRTLGVDIEAKLEVESYLSPLGIQEQTGSWRGALYGASSNNALSAFFRHRNRSTELDGLYFCGGSVHPGGGIPLCLLSARITQELIENHS